MSTQTWYYSQTNSTYKTPVSFHVLDELQSGIITIYKHTCISWYPSFKQTETAQQIPAVTVITQKPRQNTVQVVGK